MTSCEKYYENYQLSKGCKTFDLGLLIAPYPGLIGPPFWKRENEKDQ